MASSQFQQLLNDPTTPAAADEVPPRADAGAGDIRDDYGAAACSPAT